ncbi:HAD family hydrolase [Palleronia sp.]|uniref:sulfotransferase-like domain-containing protein n=1 Tax=Palleronia sp. TaxID=1940284 RepID=UPI0035C800B5
MVQIAAWSGPRNLSTAMMYAFAARGDCAVRDEPFYAPFLGLTGLDHPMRDRILAAHPTNPDTVVADFMAETQPHTYLKLMAHHMIQGVPRNWAQGWQHLHLIRHPARVIASYNLKRDTPTLDDIGFPQQVDLYEQFGGVVIGSATIRADPPAALSRLCDALGLPFKDAMLRWPAGSHPSDGVWASHWYGAVHGSTGFAGPEGDLPVLEDDAARLADAAMPFYETLLRRAITTG